MRLAFLSHPSNNKIGPLFIRKERHHKPGSAASQGQNGLANLTISASPSLLGMTLFEPCPKSMVHSSREDHRGVLLLKRSWAGTGLAAGSPSCAGIRLRLMTLQRATGDNDTALCGCSQSLGAGNRLRVVAADMHATGLALKIPCPRLAKKTSPQFSARGRSPSLQLCCSPHRFLPNHWS